MNNIIQQFKIFQVQKIHKSWTTTTKRLVSTINNVQNDFNNNFKRHVGVGNSNQKHWTSQWDFQIDIFHSLVHQNSTPPPPPPLFSEFLFIFLKHTHTENNNYFNDIIHKTSFPLNLPILGVGGEEWYFRDNRIASIATIKADLTSPYCYTILCFRTLDKNMGNGS